MQPADVHISSNVLRHSYNTFYGQSDKIKEFNAKLRAVGVRVKKSVRSCVGDTSCVTSGVDHRCLRTDHPSFSKINWKIYNVRRSSCNAGRFRVSYEEFVSDSG